jgi:DNA primase
MASRRAGYSDDELLATGLAQRSRARPGSIYDRFRGRIMFPAADARGRVHGFGARRMREEADGPGASAKYLNTSDGELYHKREVLFGIDLARSPAAKAARMILVEGYTDVLALHQAGIRNVVGIMGTSLTEEQIRELERVVKILELCLDADRAGQEAMLRASRLAAGRDLELRVVPLPEGTDPADLIERDGADALRALVQSSTPFVVFNVGRILDHADTRSAEGRDRALAELRPLLNEMGPSVLRDDLVRRVAGRLELTEGRLATLLTSGGSAGGLVRAGRPGNGSGPGASAAAAAAGGPAQATRGERLFLALCLAVPDVGARILADLDIDEILTSTTLRRAARHLAAHLRAPLSDLPADDEEFARTISGLVELAGRVPDPSADRLEHARLILDLDRLERAIIRARADGVGTSDLARQRELVRDAMREAVARLEKTL